MDKKQMSQIQERMYLAVAVLAERLYNAGLTMKCSQLVNWINRNFWFPHPYASARGVIQAAYRRANFGQQDALEVVFTRWDGKPLL